ncbi:MAG: glycoside hydrolase family 2 [Clostridia bacterium]|nr:glycoside hydrolase family 2 [Clostridia bacterium]
MKQKNQKLYTPFDEYPTQWENEYPRPTLKRDSFIPLLGEWDLSVLKNGKENYIGKIKVPFPPESLLSGICRELKKGEKYIYTKEFTLESDKNVILHFGAVDQIAEVYINDTHVITHNGGYLPFEVDITEHLKENNILKVVVTDDLDRTNAYGKQRKKRGGMWYTPISGIWQTVWLEEVPKEYIKGLWITPTLDSVKIETVGGEKHKKLVIFDYLEGPDGDLIKSEVKVYEFDGSYIKIDIDDPIHWSPDKPYLYEFSIECGEDKIESYFALRTITVDKNRILLNGRPYFFHGLLDQGYYSDGIYTPVTTKGFRYDIMISKRLGFNTLRKHIKIEPEIFYHYCDKYGMIVFQDMVNCGGYNYLLDTVLPTIGIKKGLTRPVNDKTKAAFRKISMDMMRFLYNHPSVCYYTIFNEGWGQHDADKLYRKFKEFDPSRIYDTASGWFRPKESDVISEHVYFKKVNIKHKGDKPLVLSEFGGYSCKIPEHSFNLSKTYGYKYFDNTKDFTKALDSLYRNEIIPMIEKGLCAAVLTQLSDIEDETNGLVTYDRRVLKTDIKVMQNMSKALFDKFDEVINEK